MNSTMMPLRVTLDVSRPIVAPNDPIHLDALLAWAAVERATQEGWDDPLSAQEALPLARSRCGRVWQASQLLYVPLDTPQRLAMTKRFELTEFAEAKGKVYAGGPNRFTQGTGAYKAFAMSIPLLWVEQVVAYCIGDPDGVLDLLQDITSVGKYARMNMGAVTARSVEADPRAHVGWRFRVMPEQQRGFEPVEATLRPPYWRRENRQPAWRPASIPDFLLEPPSEDDAITYTENMLYVG